MHGWLSRNVWHIWFVVGLFGSGLAWAESPVLRVATFDVDATPPIGSVMAYDRVARLDELGLRCRGVVILGADQPLVLCAVDWIGIGNGAHDAFRKCLAEAAGTSMHRVAVHTLHQHDAPRSDFTAEQLLHQVGASDLGALEGSVARDLLKRLKPAVENSIAHANVVTHAGFGSAVVNRIASNRRILDEQGRVRATRYTATRDPVLRAEPEGVIDPELSCLSFWNGDQAVAVLTYYACHPQSYYRTGIPSADFPGIARFMRGQDYPQALHLHFNGAGGNIGAGKYNDGAPSNRMRLAQRMADAMRRAFEATERSSVVPSDVRWDFEPVSLPPADHLDRGQLEKQLVDWNAKDYWGSPEQLAWLLRCQQGHKIEIGCLSIGQIRVLHMPGELFVEYQLHAKELRPDLQVAMAAYGDYGPGYIGTEAAYQQGGYETSQQASKVAPHVEGILNQAVAKLLGVTP